MKLEEAMPQSRMLSAERVRAKSYDWYLSRSEGYTLIHNAEQSLYRSAVWRFPTLEALITYAQQYSAELNISGDEWLPDNAEIRNQLWRADGPAPFAPPNLVTSCPI